MISSGPFGPYILWFHETFHTTTPAMYELDNFDLKMKTNQVLSTIFCNLYKPFLKSEKHFAYTGKQEGFKTFIICFYLETHNT